MNLKTKRKKKLMNKDMLDKYTKEELAISIQKFSIDIVTLMKNLIIGINKFEEVPEICVANMAALMELNDILQSKKILHDIMEDDQKQALIQLQVYFNELKERMDIAYARNI